MSSARFIVGTVFEALATLPDDSVDLVMTSPPFLALRSYLPADHPDKAKEIGSEPTPGEFIDTLLDVVEAIDRVLAPHGSICVELGDTYSGSGGAGGDYGNPDKTNARRDAPSWAGSAAARRQAPRSPRPKYADVDGGPLRNRAIDESDGLIPPRSHTRREVPGWPIDKSLSLIPELFRVALAYGVNPLTGRETPRWRVRNVVRWHRPNPPVGSLGDKFRPATSDLVVLCKSRTRYFDLDAVRGPGSANTHARLSARDSRGRGSRPNEGKAADDDRRGGNFSTLAVVDSDGTAPPLDTWIIPTAPYKGSHYATFPPALCVKPVLAMSPERVCRVCGEPARRQVKVSHKANRATNGPQSEERKHLQGGSAGYKVRADRLAETTGWSDCGHDDWRRGVVLDPFAGSGTTLAVATAHGRDALGIDLDERNAELASERVGMFLTIEHPFGAKKGPHSDQEAAMHPIPDPTEPPPTEGVVAACTVPSVEGGRGLE